MGHKANMGDDGNYAIDTTDSGASATVSVEAGQIRVGGHIMIKGKPCKVKNISVSKTGKHGHAKCKFSATDIFTGATCEELCPSSHRPASTATPSASSPPRISSLVLHAKSSARRL